MDAIGHAPELAESGELAVGQPRLAAGALQLVHPNSARPNAVLVDGWPGHLGAAETELHAHDMRFGNLKPVAAHGAPFARMVHLQQAGP